MKATTKPKRRKRRAKRSRSSRAAKRVWTRWAEAPAEERDREPYLERSSDGYVHSEACFMTRSAYQFLCRENPRAGLPEYDQLPLAEPIFSY